MKQANYAPTIAGNGGGGGTLTTLSFPCARAWDKTERESEPPDTGWSVLFYWNGHRLVGPVQAILIGVHPRKKITNVQIGMVEAKKSNILTLSLSLLCVSFISSAIFNVWQGRMTLLAFPSSCVF